MKDRTFLTLILFMAICCLACLIDDFNRSKDSKYGYTRKIFRSTKR